MAVKGNDYLEAKFEGKVNPASVDLEISNEIVLVHFGGFKPRLSIQRPDFDPYSQILLDAADFEPVIRNVSVDLNNHPSGIWVRPGVGILCTTKTYVKMPDNVVGQVLLKSSRGREFYQSCLAGFIDNGFEGQITLELYAPVVPIFLQTGFRIVQLRVDTVEDFSMTYKTQPDAKYLGQMGPTISKDHKW